MVQEHVSSLVQVEVEELFGQWGTAALAIQVLLHAEDVHTFYVPPLRSQTYHFRGKFAEQTNAVVRLMVSHATPRLLYRGPHLLVFDHGSKYSCRIGTSHWEMGISSWHSRYPKICTARGQRRIDFRFWTRELLGRICTNNHQQFSTGFFHLSTQSLHHPW